MNNIHPLSQVPPFVQTAPTSLSEEVEKEFAQFHAELENFQKAAANCPQERDEEAIKTYREGISLLENKIRDQLKTTDSTYKESLNAWHNKSAFLIDLYETAITNYASDVQTNCEDCIQAYNLIEGQVNEEAAFIQANIEARDKSIASIQKSITSHQTKDMHLFFHTLQQSEVRFRSGLANLTTQKIEGIKSKLDATSPLFGNFLTKNYFDPFAYTPYPVMSALGEARNFKTISPQQMKFLLTEIDLRKKFFEQIYLLKRGFLSNTYPLEARAEQFVQAQIALTKSRQAIEAQAIIDSSPPSNSIIICPLQSPSDDEKVPDQEFHIFPPLTLDTHTKCTSSEISPPHAWYLTLLRAYTKYAPVGIKKANRKPAIKKGPDPAINPPLPVLLKLPERPAPVPSKLPVIEQIAKSICSFMRQVVTQYSSQQPFVTINGKDILNGEEVEAVFTAIHNFGCTEDNIPDCHNPLLQLLHG